MISEDSYNPFKIFINQTIKYYKGFILLGHDFRSISYGSILRELSPFKSKTIKKNFYKNKADQLLTDYIKNYKPDIIIVATDQCFNLDSVIRLRGAVPNAIIIGVNGDPWPKLKPAKLNTAKGFDIMMATNDGEWLKDYQDAGVPKCFFIPNMCDPDIDKRYEVGQNWQTDILWVGKSEHKANKRDTFRPKLIAKLAECNNCTLYGCHGNPKIMGLESLYAISGAKIGVSVNAYEGVRLAHSDRLTRFLAGGTMVLAKKFPDCELLYKDGVHLKYFDTIEEFFELTDYYLKHEEERKKIANQGMKWIHEQFNCVKIAGYILELAEKSLYSASWFEHLLINKKNSP